MAISGNILNIQRFSLHDGPGIRTTVFLKGCPLRCAWCSNPESQLDEPQLGYNARTCTQCFDCTGVCAYGALKVKNGKLVVDRDKCTACGRCLEMCMPGSLKIYGRVGTAEEIIREVIKDKVYYERSGGGLTLSGGDPMWQVEFSREILLLAKENGIRTCIETAGYADREDFDRVIPVTDLFLYDYKITDDFFHRRYTKKSNQAIIENLHYLDSLNANIVLRCIIIPGINDNEEHFKAITRLSLDLDNIHAVEVIPYHDFGREKYEQIGFGKYPLEEKTVSHEQALLWVSKLMRIGCEKALVGS